MPSKVGFDTGNKESWLKVSITERPTRKMPEEAKGTCDLETQPETFVFQADIQIETDFVVMTKYSVIPGQRPG